jgi:hypothetical protein
MARTVCNFASLALPHRLKSAFQRKRIILMGATATADRLTVLPADVDLIKLQLF